MNIIKTITIRLEDELHKKFKKYSVDIEKDMQAIIVDFIKELTEKKKSEEQ